MSYLSSVSPEYLEELRALYQEDPNAVPLTWRLFFDGMEFGQTDQEIPYANGHDSQAQANLTSSPSANGEAQLLQLIQNYRQYGHHKAQLSPLQSAATVELNPLDQSLFQLKGVDNKTTVQLANKSFFNGLKVQELENHLKKTYCSFIGAEYMHIENPEIRQWFSGNLEKNQAQPQHSPEEKKQILQTLTQAEGFESFVQKNYTGQKRFSLEGGESLIPALQSTLHSFASQEGQEVVIGMAHRGRLNVLTNIMKKPYGAVFAEFEGLKNERNNGGGDVKYHLGFSSDIEYKGKKLHLSLAFNPSHLEAVNPVVEGMTRAKQVRVYEGDYNKVLPILIHGDAAVIGQGVVVETMNMAYVEGYKTGGTIHFVINNQVGFTTSPPESRSSVYCTDFAKGIQAPILHVNGNKPEYVVFAAQLAAEFRAKFGRDIFIDILCYRKYGHNEGDEPRFTQPLMYNEMSKIKSPKATYSEELTQSGVLTDDEAKQMSQNFHDHLDSELAPIKEGKSPDVLKPYKGLWEGFKPATEKDMIETINTSLSESQFHEIIETIHGPFENFNLLPKLQKMLQNRKDLVLKEDIVDWAVGEQLAFGSILNDGFNLRLSGQDSRRGTFSHRHLVYTDAESAEKIIPLQKLQKSNSVLGAWNSPLSEYAVMGFDYGFSLSDPKALVLWEGQFGDFANGAQIVIDQFIAASENKWSRVSGITLLLPHGYEGQGPEHSSARLERFLQLCAEGNIQVAYPTTPAQYCHVLRRQLLRPFRKPLIIMSPKSPLRMPEVVSRKKDFTEGHFENILISGAAPAQSEKVIFCTGKVYWDLLKAAQKLGRDKTTTFVRLEQIYPLDVEKIKKIQSQYSKAKDWVWCQEEPKNMGAWSFLLFQTGDWLKLRFVGRKPSPSVATGSPKIHAKELEDLISEAFS